MAAILYLPLAAAIALFAAVSSLQAQQGQPPQGQQPEEEEPTPAPLTVSSMAIASDAMLAVSSMAVDVSVDRITYRYALRNKGPKLLSLAASVALPDLEVNNEGTTFFVLPASNPQNVVGLQVSADDKPVTTTPYLQAIALGIDRAADLKTANIPLIPFGEATEKALAAAKPETIETLGRLGLVTPRDPQQPQAPIIADWSLRVVHGWTQELKPNAETKVTVGFMPIRAVYTIDASAIAGFDSLKEQVCLTPVTINAVKALLRAKGATADVADITLSNDGPARWLGNPQATIAVRKPTPDAIVSFCGVDAASQGKPVVTGKLPSASESGGIRVLIFARNQGQ